MDNTNLGRYLCRLRRHVACWGATKGATSAEALFGTRIAGVSIVDGVQTACRRGPVCFIFSGNASSSIRALHGALGAIERAVASLSWTRQRLLLVLL